MVSVSCSPRGSSNHEKLIVFAVLLVVPLAGLHAAVGAQKAEWPFHWGMPVQSRGGKWLVNMRTAEIVSAVTEVDVSRGVSRLRRGEIVSR